METEIVKQEEVVKEPKKKVEYFTDEMLRNLYVFQPPISSRGFGGTNPSMEVIKFARTKK
jgi:hypothetical protein